nr:unnamed protein product [Callosobruchus analis]
MLQASKILIKEKQYFYISELLDCKKFFTIYREQT